MARSRRQHPRNSFEKGICQGDAAKIVNFPAPPQSLCGRSFCEEANMAGGGLGFAVSGAQHGRENPGRTGTIRDIGTGNNEVQNGHRAVCHRMPFAGFAGPAAHPLSEGAHAGSESRTRAAFQCLESTVSEVNRRYSSQICHYFLNTFASHLHTVLGTPLRTLAQPLQGGRPRTVRG